MYYAVIFTSRLTPEHREIQHRGRREWYQEFKIRMAKVEEERP